MITSYSNIASELRPAIKRLIWKGLSKLFLVAGYWMLVINASFGQIVGDFRTNGNVTFAWDDKYPGADSLPVEYEWQFSDGVVLKGLSVEHCFPGAGKYQAKLNIIDNATSNTFFTQTSLEFDIIDFEQPYITSKDTSGVSEELQFSGLKSNLPGFHIEEYIWDFGDGDYMTGPDVSHSYKREGLYNVKLGLTGKMNENKNRVTYCIFKPIRILSVK